MQGFNFSATQPNDLASGLPTGKTVFAAVIVSRSIDSATTKLLQAMSTNENLPQAGITVMSNSPSKL
jgi:type VI protein secretion system component Hcp